jgi:hypothetical protein
MPGFLLHSGAVVMCAHAGTATPTAPNPRVTVSGQAIVTMTSPYAIAGCTFPAMTSGAQPPCATAQWTTAAVRVTALGQPVLLQDSIATCIPTGTPLFVTVVQPRVSGI